jgi:hypothetical protein
MEQLGLAETIEAVRAELEKAITVASGSKIQFPVQGVQLEFHVAVERVVGIEAGVKLWVVELGSSGEHRNEEIQKVTVTLGAPIDEYGSTVVVARNFDEKP